MNKCQVLFHGKNFQRLLEICLEFIMGNNYYLDQSISLIISCINIVKAIMHISEGFYHIIFRVLLLLVILLIIL